MAGVRLLALAISVSFLSVGTLAVHRDPNAPAATARANQPNNGAVRVTLTTSGNEKLGALLYAPTGRGPFPAVLMNHGSGRTREQLAQLGPYEQVAEIQGPVFVRHGYVLLYVFRHGVGLSTDAGKAAVDLMDEEMAAHGQHARNMLQLQLLDGRDMADAEAGLDFLKHRPDVDHARLAVVGHSFGGSLTVLMTEREPSLKAAVLFSTAGYSWDNSSELRDRLLGAVRKSTVPMFFIHAANDYSVNSGKTLDAELARLGKPHRLEIYPAVGRTPDDGHDFPNNSIAVWENEVFRFLDSYVNAADRR
jgi:dienelactone hydrolase